MATIEPKLVLFDLDGTLVDSVPDLHVCVNEMLVEMGRDEYTEDEVRKWVGNGVDRLVKRALTNDMTAEPADDVFAEAIALFHKTYSVNCSRYSLVFPGVKEGLAYLKERGVHIACVTNKAEKFTLPLLESLGLSPWMEITVSGDTLEKCKPDPMPLLHVAKELGVDPSESVMVGDSRHDMKAARSAGFGAVAVPYGYNHGDDVADTNPDMILETIADVHRLFE